MEVEQVIHGLILSCMLNCPQTRYWTPNCLLLNLETSQGAFDLALCITPDEQVGTLPVPFTINVNGECDKCHKAQKYRKALYECRCIYYLLSKVTQLLKSAKHQRIFPQETSFSGLCSFLKERVFLSALLDSSSSILLYHQYICDRWANISWSLSHHRSQSNSIRLYRIFFFNAVNRFREDRP